MGTEHFISDLHGEYAAVRHILNNSGVILEKVLAPFRGRDRGGALPKPGTLIYYPHEKLSARCATPASIRMIGSSALTMLGVRTLAETLSTNTARSLYYF